MNKSNAVFNIFSALLVIILTVTGVFSLDKAALLGDIAVISVVSVMPESLLCLSKSVLVESLQSDEKGSSDSQNNQKIDNEEKQEAIDTSVEEKVMGSIIKKTISPYSANTKHGLVYINNTSGADINAAAMLSKDLPFKVVKNSEPQVLIYHTLTTEAYMDNEEQYYTDSDEARTTDCSRNVAAVGEVMAKILESAGYSVIHDKTLHDYPGYSGSYSRSEETVKEILKKYPSIKIVIDVHRDSISSGDTDKVAPVVEIDGKKAAQVMLVMGSETGSIKDHPNWKQNLILATKLQYCMEDSYPQLARSVLLRSAKYNQDLSNGSILIEMGSDANTFDEAIYSGELVGEALVKLLDSQM